MNDEIFKQLSEVEECIRWYPTDLSIISNSEYIFEKNSQPRNIDLYVHIPFCKGTCGFCPFNQFSYVEKKVKEYVSSLEKEIAILDSYTSLSFLKPKTIWIGGGTPSDLEDKLIEKVLELIQENFKTNQVKEFTFEGIASEQSLTKSKLELLKTYEINRISLGVQSLNPKYLKILGRRYTHQQAKQIIKDIKNMNFVLNVDMMYRLPGQNIEELLYDVENITSLGIDHITWFPYMPVPDTRVYKEIKKGKLPERPDLKEYFHMYRTLIERMNKKGYKEYTPYHFSLPDKECVYNKDRWGIPQQETVGIGAGAFSFFNNWIYANAHNVEDYLKLLNDKKYPALIGKKLTPEEKISRLAVLGIKLLSISKKEFKKHSGIEIETFYKNELKEIENLHLVKINEESIDCTLLGKAFNNDISKRFFVGSSRGKKQPLPINLKKVRI